MVERLDVDFSEELISPFPYFSVETDNFHAVTDTLSRRVAFKQSVGSKESRYVHGRKSTARFSSGIHPSIM